MNERKCQKNLSHQEKHILPIFCLQGLITPYQEDLKPPTQHYVVSESQTEFSQESWMRGKNFEDDYIKIFENFAQLIEYRNRSVV